MRSLIVTADDFGLSRSINDGIVEGHDRGAIAAASVSACGLAFDHAVSLARKCPALDTGVHLTLDDERPVLSGLRTLVAADGRFLPRVRLVERLVTGRVDLDEVRACWRAQIQKCLAERLRLTFINSHGHIHAFPSLLPVAIELAREFGIPAIRRPVEHPWLRVGDIADPKHLLVSAAARWSFRNGRSVASADWFEGLRCSGRLDRAALGGVYHRLRSGVTELMVHPGRVDDDTRRRYAAWHYTWENELDSLLAVRPPPDVVSTTFAHAFGGTD